jgi:hypothetical protein
VFPAIGMPEKLPLLLTLLTYMTHRDVGNADIAGAYICPCRQHLSCA